MNFSLRPPGGNRTWNAVVVFLFGAFLLWVGLRGASKALAVLGGVFFISGLGLWGRLPWARWTGGLGLLLYAGMTILGMAVGKGFRWNTSIMMVFAVWIAWQILTGERDDPRKDDGDDEKVDPAKPLTSFVLLLNGPRRLTATQLSIIVTRAWGGTYASHDDVDQGSDEQKWVVGKSPVFLMKSEEAIYMLHNFPAPYSTESKEMAQSVPDLRLRKAIEEHRAWLAVDLMSPFDPTRSRESFYPAIARLIAELAGDDCLAVYHPESNRINAWDDGLKAALRGPDPLKKFATAVNPPVLQVSSEDPELLAGKAEARRRFPEFVEAFRKKDGDHFSIKAPVTAGGRTEHIWIQVDSVDDDRVGGRLGNDPVSLGGMKLGDHVEVAIADVEDWVLVRGGSPVGLFTARTVGKSLKKT